MVIFVIDIWSWLCFCLLALPVWISCLHIAWTLPVFWPWFLHADSTVCLDYCFKKSTLNRTCILCDLIPGPYPLTVKPLSAEHDGEEEENASPEVNNKCTDVCGNSLCSLSCSEICLIEVYHKGNPDKAVKLYAILDDPNNQSLARSEFLGIFCLKSTESPYILCICTRVKRCLGGELQASSLNGTCNVSLPMIIVCNHMLNDKSEIPTPEAAKHHSLLSYIAHLIPPLNTDPPPAWLQCPANSQGLRMHLMLRDSTLAGS